MFLPNELLSDISNFVPDDDVKNLTFLSRAFATVTAKRLPILSVKNKILSKVRRVQWPPIRTMMAKHNYDPRVQSPNADGEKTELSFCSGDLITVYGEMDEDGFYFGELNGARGYIPSNFLDPTTPNTIALLSPQAKAWIYSFYQYELYPYMAAQNHIVPTKILSDISNFIPDDDVKNLTFVSRAFAVVMMKKLPIIEAKNEVISKDAHVRTMIAKWDYDPRIHSPNDDGEQEELSFCSGDKISVFGEKDTNGFYLGELNGVRRLVPSNFLEPAGDNIMRAKYDYDSKLSPNIDGDQVELSFCKGDKITVYGEMDEDGFYLGALNGVRGLVPSNFLHATIPNTPIMLMPPQVKASEQSPARDTGPSNRPTNNKTPEYPGEVCALMCFRRIFAKDESTENRLTEREKTVASNLYAPGMPDRIGYGRDNWETVSMGSSSRHNKFQEDVATVMMEPKHSKTVAAKHRAVKSNATADKPPVPMTREVSDSEIAVYLPPDIKKHSETGRIRKM
ncbi:variant SH3 domain-containing protein [Ditylenchus destructor]|nr:variant SH3 domain-containing protein [Ditylenchus destructor]